MKYHRQLKRKRIVPWPTDAGPAAMLAAKTTYVGSGEHKNYPSPAGPPRLRRNDASPCDPRYVDFDTPTCALRKAITAHRVSDFVGEFPKYVWGPLDSDIYEARLVNHVLGTYKAYPLRAEEELPEDPDGVLEGMIPWRR